MLSTGALTNRHLLMATASVDWEAAVRTYTARVVASLVARGVPFDQAEELTSQTWARLLEKDRAGQLPVVTLPGLAIKQAQFFAHAWLRSTRRHGALPEQEPSSGSDPEHLLMARQDVEIALAVLARSSPSAQAVFRHLYDDPPPSHQAVAERVGLSLQRVRQILCEVRRTIRLALEER